MAGVALGSGSKSGDGRRVQHLSLGPKHGAVARTVPAVFKAVPVQVATEVRAGRGMLMNISVGIAVGGNLP